MNSLSFLWKKLGMMEVFDSLLGTIAVYDQYIILKIF